MRRVFYMLLDAGIAAIIFLPLFFFLNKRYFHNPKRTVWYFLLAVYLSGVYSVVGLPDICYFRLDLHINLVPFAYMFSDYTTSLLNVLLFIPMGFFLPVLWGSYQRPARTLLFGLSMSLMIELLQIFTFRATDINDLMTNTLGTFLGWCLGRGYRLVRPAVAAEQEQGHIGVVCGVSFCVMFFLHPLLSRILLG